MKPMQIRNASVFLAMLLLAACAPNPPKTPEETVLARSKAKWEAIFAKDYARAYQYLSPGFRELYSEEAWARRVERQPVKWLSADVLSAECTGRVCKVKVDLQIRVKPRVPGVPPVEVPAPITENWLMDEDGQWYYVPKR